jgi:hypothetical protein
MSEMTIEELSERDVVVSLVFWRGQHNRWRVDDWSDDLTTVDVTNVGGMEELKHSNVPVTDVLVLTVDDTPAEAWTKGT